MSIVLMKLECISKDVLFQFDLKLLSCMTLDQLTFVLKLNYEDTSFFFSSTSVPGKKKDLFKISSAKSSAKTSGKGSKVSNESIKGQSLPLESLQQTSVQPLSAAEEEG